MIAPPGFEPGSQDFFTVLEVPESRMIGRYILQRFFLFYRAMRLSKE